MNNLQEPYPVCPLVHLIACGRGSEEVEPDGPA
jgi:hypothetical protein